MKDLQVSTPNGIEEEEFACKDLALLFSGRLKSAIESLPEELRHLPESDLHERARPTPIDWALRERFSSKVKEAIALKTKHIPTARIYEDLAQRSNFEDRLLANPIKVAWFTRPLVEHSKMYEAINRLALAKIYRILETTEVDPKNLLQILKVAEQAANRAYGAVAQKMQIQSKNLNIEAKADQLPPPQGHEELTKQIEAMQSKLLHQRPILDVTPESDPE